MSRRAPRIPAPRHVSRQAAYSHPVAASVGRSNIASLVRSLKIQIWVKAFGEEATACLANLSLVIGLGAETELAANGTTQDLRVLHGALRTVHGWCMSGYTWQIEDPAGIERAIDLAHKVVLARPDIAMSVMSNATYLCDRVYLRQVTADDVAGAEIYQDTSKAAA